MLVRAILLGAACLLCGCASDGTNDASPTPYVYSDWLYYQQRWYDDDFWMWADDHPDCCHDREDLKDALKDWFDDLDPERQRAVRDRVQGWMDDHDVVPAAGQSPRELVLETASERWAALTPAERQQWAGQRAERIEQRRASGPASPPAARQRAADLDPQERAALRESAQGAGLEPPSGRPSSGSWRATASHPTPGRAGLSGGPRFKAARGGGGGRGGRGR
jgi:hypothetical protein